MDADAVELRVLGCLIEKQRTTPDVYPLSLNALRLACNQATNRDPVVEYDEPTIRAALERLSRKGWTRLASGAGSRAIKYRHLLDVALELSDADQTLLCMLMLRGPQTLGELKQRSDRLYRFESLEGVAGALDGLIARDLAARLERRPGQKEDRYTQLLGGADPATTEPVATGAADRRPPGCARATRRAARAGDGLAPARRDGLDLRDPGLERGAERLAHRLELDPVEHVLEEAAHDQPLGLGARQPARHQVEELLPVDLAERRAVGAADVVGEDLEARESSPRAPRATASGCGSPGRRSSSARPARPGSSRARPRSPRRAARP